MYRFCGEFDSGLLFGAGNRNRYAFSALQKIMVATSF